MLIPLLLMLLLVFERRCQVDLGAVLGTQAGGRAAGSRAPALAVWLVVTAIALACVWAVYGLSFGPSRALGVAVPAPAWLDGLVGRVGDLKASRSYYLDGAVSSVGWWTWFAWAALYKTPLGAFVLAAFALVAVLRRDLRVPPTVLACGAVLLVYAGAIAASRIDLGLRYMLPLYPFAFLVLGALAQARRWRWVSLAVAALAIASTVLHHPDHLGRMNELIASDRRYRHLVDSNLDWGQDLPALAGWQARHHVARIRLGYFGTADPRRYGVDAEPLPSFLTWAPYRGPRELRLEGVIAVSATLLAGLYLAQPDFYAALRERAPDGHAGTSILIYEFP